MLFKVFNPDVIILYSLENRISQNLSEISQLSLEEVDKSLLYIFNAYSLAEKHHFCRLAFHDFIF